MPTWNERRRYAQRGDDSAAYGERGAPRGRNQDDPREDIHHGPWSPYNGLARERRDRDDDRESWDTRGRDYWLEDDRWEDQRMGMGDQWRHRSERDDQDDGRYGDEAWGNRMGMREEPSERAVPRAGAWQHEPRYGEMERMWSDRDDHPWPNERRATDEERREHRDYAHPRRDDRGDYRGRDEQRGREHREPQGHDEYRGRHEQRGRDEYRGHRREHRDDYARERGGEQYPSRMQGSWHDDRYRGWRDEEPRYWTDREDRRDDRRFEREDQRYAEQKREHEQRLRHGREEQRLRDEERFGRHEPEWTQRAYPRGPDDRGERRMQPRDDRGMQHRDDRGLQHRDDDRVQPRDDRGLQHRDDRDRRRDRNR